MPSTFTRIKNEGGRRYLIEVTETWLGRLDDNGNLVPTARRKVKVGSTAPVDPPGTNVAPSDARRQPMPTRPIRLERDEPSADVSVGSCD